MNAPDGRSIHHWRGKNREQDVAALADAIAGIGELVNNEGALFRLDGDGKLTSVNLAGLQEFVGKHICGVRVVVRDGVGQRRYFSYAFPPLPKGPPRFEDRNKGVELIEPDDKVLKQIYIDELLWRIPPVKS
jgi:hypothetical protein